MDVPPTIIVDMNAISSNNASYIPEQQIKTYLKGYVPSILNGSLQIAALLSQQEDDDWGALTMKKIEGEFGHLKKPTWT